ncbi:hypothetical protein CR513_38730, partial [Mucuna pruriens]
MSKPTNGFHVSLEHFLSCMCGHFPRIKALHVVPKHPLPNSSAEPFISCSSVYPCTSPAQNTKFPLFATSALFTFSSSSLSISIRITAAASAVAAASAAIIPDRPSFLLRLLCFLTTAAAKHASEQTSTNTPAENPIISARRSRCFFSYGCRIKPLTPCTCALWPSAAVGGAAGPKKGCAGRHCTRMISPQRLGLKAKEEGGKRKSVGVTGMAPERLLPETSKIRREDWLNGGIEPLKERSRLVKAAEIGPERLLREKSKFRRRWSEKSEGGREAVKWLLSRKMLLRLKRPVRSGIGPVSELFCKLRTRSWSRRVRVFGAQTPPRSKPWRTRRTTLAPLHSTPCHAQNGKPRVKGGKSRWLLASAFCLNARRAVASVKTNGGR